METFLDLAAAASHSPLSIVGFCVASGVVIVAPLALVIAGAIKATRAAADMLDSRRANRRYRAALLRAVYGR